MQSDSKDTAELFLQSKLFNEALSKQTSHYIQSKLLSLPKDAQDLKKLDLRHMCQTVVEQLQVVEKEAAYDYIQVSEELQSLGNELTVTDNIMQELENVLYSFKDHLQSIKCEMTSLQEKSNKMNTSLNNRKKLQNILGSFIQSAVLDKELIDAICLSQINENYVTHIKSLQKKLSYLNNNLISPDSKAVKQLQPQLQKLKMRASGRLRQFLIEQINSLKKPKTNIQIVQKNVLVKYKVFTEFFKDYFPTIFTELCNTYREIMAKVYLANYKVYLQEIYKLQVELYVKTDQILPDPQSLRSFLTQTKPTNLNQDKRSIYTLMARDKIILHNDNNDIILYNVANQTARKYTPQQIFKSVNKVLMDGVLSQVVFTAQFFNVRSEGAIQLFGPLFRPSLNVFIEYLKSTVAQTYDIFGVLLMIAINEKNKQTFHQKYFSGLDFYFDQINMTLWPKFQELFQSQIKSLSSFTPKMYKALQKTSSAKVLSDRFGDFLVSFYKLLVHFSNSKMINVRMENIRKAFFDLIKKVCDECQKQVDGMAYYLNILETYHANLASENTIKSKEFYDEQAKVEKDITIQSDKIVLKYIGQFFPSIDSVIKKYSKEDGQISIQGNVQQKVIDTIINDLSPNNFSAKMQKLMGYCQKIYTGYCLKVLLKNFMNSFLNYYTQIYKYVKANFPDSAAMMLQPHNMMKEIKTIFAKYIS